MLLLTLAGNTGRDAEYKQTQGGAELCSFPVATETGYGDNKVTTWVDVTRWGKGAEKLADILRKGSRVAVSGEMSTREHNGKTYIQCRADHVKILGTPGGQNGDRQRSNSGGGGDGWSGQAPADDWGRAGGGAPDLDDDIPFITNRSIF